MGFGSYDESEQGKREIDTEEFEDSDVEAQESEHEGSVEFEFDASNEELLDRLQDIKG